MINILKSPKTLLIVISIFLFILPFFWMQPGEMDLGGDSNRLYFYEPFHYMQNYLLYAISPVGFGTENPLYLSLPFVLILILLKYLGASSYLLITFLNSITLVIAFLAMFAILKHILQYKIDKQNKTLAYFVSIFVGFYYILSPIMIMSAWDKALLTHLQIFLNPLLFYLFLRFVETSKIKYLLIILVITFIFSTSFSWAAAPPLFAFYPLALTYLFLYGKFILKKTIPFKPLLIFSGLFLLIHIFHVGPLVAQIVGQNGDAFSRAFTAEGKFDIGLSYFLATAAYIQLSRNLLGLPQMAQSMHSSEYLFIIFPFIIIAGLIINITQKKINKTQRYSFLLLLVFLSISIFLATANITKIGLNFYSSLFNIPGFSMFRNYYGQWLFVYLFFMSLAIGFGLFRVMSILRVKYFQWGLGGALFLLIVLSAVPFIKGDMINYILNKGQKVEFKVPIKMDPDFEKALNGIRQISYDGKFLLFPHTEAFNHMVAGTQGGMYQGPSMISALAEKNDFAGYQVIKPFSEIFLKTAEEEDKSDFIRLLSVLNIKYIFYNADPKIMSYFPDFPYSHVKKFLPNDQKGYQTFINTLPVKKINEYGGKYIIYEIDKDFYLPHIYVAKDVVLFKRKLDQWGYVAESFYSKNKEIRTAYVEQKIEKIDPDRIPSITFTRINPTKYYIDVKNAQEPYVLVFSNLYNPNWKLFSVSEKSKKTETLASYFNGQIVEGKHTNTLIDKNTFETWWAKPVAADDHFQVNAFSNGWRIEPNDVQNKKDYTLVLELTSQRWFYIFIPISAIVFLIVLSWLIIELYGYKKNEKAKK